MRSFVITAKTSIGADALRKQSNANLKQVVISDEPLSVEFILSGRMKLFVKEGDVRRTMGLTMKLFGAYEPEDYMIEVKA